MQDRLEITQSSRMDRSHVLNTYWKASPTPIKTPVQPTDGCVALGRFLTISVPGQQRYPFHGIVAELTRQSVHKSLCVACNEPQVDSRRAHKISQ